MRKIGLSLMITFVIASGFINGCASSRGYSKMHVNTWTSNEKLRTVHFKKEGQSAPVGLRTFDWVTVRTKIAGGTCEAALAEAMGFLLKQSQELGGNSVYLVQSKGTRNWLDVGVCNRDLGWQEHKYQVRMRGLAAYDPKITD